MIADVPTIMRPADVEVMFQFNNVRKGYVADGYRPAHLIKDDYLPSGVHHYYDVDEVFPNQQAKGTITFISPEAYPDCLWVGKKISIQEGEKVVGCATVLKILNLMLDNRNAK